MKMRGLFYALTTVDLTIDCYYTIFCELTLASIADHTYQEAIMPTKNILQRQAVALEGQVLAAQDAAEATKKTAKHTRRSLWLTSISVILLFASVLTTCHYSKETYKIAKLTEERETKLFMAKEKPLIQLKPTSIIDIPKAKNEEERKGRDHPDLDFTRINFTLLNYSGFDARKVQVDLNFYKGKNIWMSEWLYADKKKNEPQKDKLLYQIYPIKKVDLPVLEALKKTKELSITGNYSLENNVYKSKNRAAIIEFRLIWENKYGYRFDRVQEFKFICATVGDSKKYSLIPLKTISSEK